MKIEEVKRRLMEGGFQVSKEDRLGNNTGVQVRLENGSIVNVYDNGTVNVQGRNAEAVRALLHENGGALATNGAGAVSNKVFVVYGHDEGAKSQLEAMLRRWGLDPLILDQLPSEGQTIIEKLENYTDKEKVGFGVILATPDDEGHKAHKADEKTYRARQNVVLELGMLLAELGRKKVAILIKDQEKMERPSDIQGLIYIPFKDSVMKEAGLTLAKEMVAQGYKIDISKL